MFALNSLADAIQDPIGELAIRASTVVPVFLEPAGLLDCDRPDEQAIEMQVGALYTAFADSEPQFEPLPEPAPLLDSDCAEEEAETVEEEEEEEEEAVEPEFEDSESLSDIDLLLQELIAGSDGDLRAIFVELRRAAPPGSAFCPLCGSFARALKRLFDLLQQRREEFARALKALQLHLTGPGGGKARRHARGTKRLF
jgi:hypothetical protein